MSVNSILFITLKSAIQPVVSQDQSEAPNSYLEDRTVLFTRNCYVPNINILLTGRRPMTSFFLLRQLPVIQRHLYQNVRK